MFVEPRDKNARICIPTLDTQTGLGFTIVVIFCRFTSAKESFPKI